MGPRLKDDVSPIDLLFPGAGHDDSHFGCGGPIVSMSIQVLNVNGFKTQRYIFVVHQTFPGGHKYLDIRIVEPQHVLQLQNSRPVQKPVVVRHPDVSLTLRIRLVDIYLSKAWLSIIRDGEERPDSMNEFALDTEGVDAGWSINRMVDIDAKRREGECIVIISNVRTKGFCSWKQKIYIRI